MAKKRVRTFSSNEVLVGERRQQIVKSATNVFVKKGFHRANVRELAKALGMSQGGLYHYIGSKDDILYLVIDFVSSNQARRNEIYRNAVANLSPTEALPVAIKMYLEGVDDIQDIFNFVNHIMVDLTKSDRQIIFDSENSIIDIYESLLIKGVEAGEFKLNNPAVVANCILVMAQAWAHRRWFLRKRCTLEEYTSEVTELIMGTIMVDKNPPITKQQKIEKSIISTE